MSLCRFSTVYYYFQNFNCPLKYCILYNKNHIHSSSFRASRNYHIVGWEQLTKLLNPLCYRFLMSLKLRRYYHIIMPERQDVRYSARVLRVLKLPASQSETLADYFLSKCPVHYHRSVFTTFLGYNSQRVYNCDSSDSLLYPLTE